VAARLLRRFWSEDLSDPALGFLFLLTSSHLPSTLFLLFHVAQKSTSAAPWEKAVSAGEFGACNLDQ